MAEIAELMRANLLDVFGERDPERRRAAIARTYHPDVVFSVGDDKTTGHQALDTTAQGILDEAPDFVFSPAGDILINDDLGYLAWNLGPEGAPPVARGMDIALVRDGLIARLYTFLLTD